MSQQVPRAKRAETAAAAHGYRHSAITPNGQTLLMNPGDKLRVHIFDSDLAGGGRALEVHIDDLTTGQREFWREVAPSYPAGLLAVYPPHLTADGKSYAFSYQRDLATLYLVRGLK